MKVEELGSLRLNIVYTEDHVFPSEHYTPLRDLLLSSAKVEVRVLSVCSPVFTFQTRAVNRLSPLPSARVGVHGSRSRGGVSGEAGSRHPARSPLSSLWQNSAFHQRHRSC